MNLRRIERLIVVGSRFLTLIAVAGSFASSLLMFLLGAYNIFEAFTEGLRSGLDGPGQFGTIAVISVIEGLDRFLIGIVLLYFGYGVYTLFIHPREPDEKLGLPDWLHIEQIGQLKQVVAEVILVILLVLFLRVALEAYHIPQTEHGWEKLASLALLPVAIVLIALALRLVELHPKGGRRREEGETDR